VNAALKKSLLSIPRLPIEDRRLFYGRGHENLVPLFKKKKSLVPGMPTERTEPLYPCVWRAGWRRRLLESLDR